MNIYDPQSEKYLRERLPGAVLTLRVMARIQYQGGEYELVANSPVEATHELVRIIRGEKQRQQARIKAWRQQKQEGADKEAQDLDPTGSAG